MKRICSLFILTVTSAAMAGLISQSTPQTTGGYAGYYTAHFLRQILGNVGAYLVISILNLSGLILLGIVSVTSLIDPGGWRKFHDT